MFSGKDFKGSTGSAVPSTLSQDLKVVGDLTCDGDIQIDGTVEGDIKCRLLTIGPSARITGTLEAETLRVSGTVIGRIDGKSVVLTRTARVEGDIVHESLTMEACAHFEGQVKNRKSGPKPKTDGKIAALQPGGQTESTDDDREASVSLSA